MDKNSTEKNADNIHPDGNPQHRLKWWNPLDYLRLLWWALVTPHQLRNHQNRFSPESAGRLSKLLVGTLIWLPILMLWLVTGLLTGYVSLSSFFWLTGGIVLAWVLTSWLGASGSKKMGFILGLVAFSIAAVVVTEAVAVRGFGMLRMIIFGLEAFVSIFLAVFVASLMRDYRVSQCRMSFNVAVSVATGVMLGVGLGLMGSLDLASDLALRFLASIILIVIVIVVLFGGADILARDVKDRLTIEYRT